MPYRFRLHTDPHILQLKEHVFYFSLNSLFSQGQFCKEHHHNVFDNVEFHGWAF